MEYEAAQLQQRQEHEALQQELSAAVTQTLREKKELDDLDVMHHGLLEGAMADAVQAGGKKWAGREALQQLKQRGEDMAAVHQALEDEEIKLDVKKQQVVTKRGLRKRLEVRATTHNPGDIPPAATTMTGFPVRGETLPLHRSTTFGIRIDVATSPV